MILFQQDLWQLLREYARKESSRLPHQSLQSQNEMNGLLICEYRTISDQIRYQ